MNDKKKNKKYVKPQADLVEFVNDDIITLSAGDKLLWGGSGDNEEPF